VTSAAIIFVLSIGEIPVTARLNPPTEAGGAPLAITLLNDMHYQRPQTVMVAAVVIIAAAFIVALLVAMISRAGRRVLAKGSAILLVGLVSCLAGCERSSDGGAHGSAAPINTIRAFGTPGLGRSQFNYPRAIDVNAANGWIYVIDKAARVQRFDANGEQQLEWRMPEFENGKPTGVSVAPPPDGRVFVPDTHYHRIIVYSADGEELDRFGEYGEGPGQFIYPTDIAFGPEDRLYISEYGGNDRVQVLDAQGKFLFEFGGFGEESGRYNRPQSLAFNADRSELFIADACNHRIVVTDPNGTVLRMFGSPGREAGQLAYPYGLAILGDGTVMVSEFGNNRVQQFDAYGRSLGVWGRVGRREGEVQYPWGVAGLENEIFVLDSGNNRVQVMREP
jgi:DNA-binding beta-propeller fold protein YncE